MKAARVFYRTRQFWQALNATPTRQDLEQVRSFLSPSLMKLFASMKPNEQAHSLAVFYKLIDQGEKQPDLLTAALLHDVGKSRFPLQVWERVLIVLGSAIFPGQIQHWGGSVAGQQGRLSWFLKKPFHVAEGHPQWGAQMAEQAGASPLTVTLIRRHQDRLLEPLLSSEDRLLAALQAVDDES
jgi:hypothetical protein